MAGSKKRERSLEERLLAAREAPGGIERRRVAPEAPAWAGAERRRGPLAPRPSEGDTLLPLDGPAVEVSEPLAPAPGAPAGDRVTRAVPDDLMSTDWAARVADATVPEPRAAASADEPWARRVVRTERFGRIGTTMIERGLITAEQLEEALDVQRATGRRVGEVLQSMGALSAFDLARVLADHSGVPFVDLRSRPLDPVVAASIPEEVARRYRALAIARWNDQLVVAMSKPTDLFALDDLQMVTRQPVIAAMAVEEDLLAAINRVYRVSDVATTVDAATSDYSAVAEQLPESLLEVDDAPVVRLVNALMDQAIRDEASDLHVEPASDRVAIRLRIDGVLHDTSSVPLALLRPLVSRLKIMAHLDIAQNRTVQDGRFSVNLHGRTVDLRVVTIPTAAGEAVILRLLDPTRDTLGIASLGMRDEELARFLPAFRASQGAVMIAGPTGSGKTSTVYSVLTEINTRSKSIISVEDPVEYRVDGVKQIQVNSRVGLTFAHTLPSILRADPDVMFIGEVRDSETARIAADASITGHLVLSTLHATSAAAAPMRLIEMGVEPYLVASALTLLVSQRLARRVCDVCAEPAPVDPALVREIGCDEAILEGAVTRRAVGCSACHQTGYRGRLPIFEIMPVTEGISRLILQRASRADIQRLAVEEGMDTLRTAALRRVAEGQLTFAEMMRVVS